MADYPTAVQPPLTVWTGSRYGIMTNGVSREQGGGALFASTAWGTANLAIFVPIEIPFSYPVKNLFWYNGATVAGNIDCGVYNDDLARVCSCGSVAQAGVTALQFQVPTTEVLLVPGSYYLAVTSSSTTATLHCQTAGTAVTNRELGLFQQLTALPLPAAATIAAAGQARIPLIGITNKTGTPSF